MLVPAVCYKDEIENALKKYFYSDEMMYYSGGIDSSTINVRDDGVNGIYQFAIVNSDNTKLLGYISYTTNYYSSCVYNFGLFSFDRGNPIVGRESFNVIEELIKKHHRVEFRAVSGNPATRGYDSLLERHKDIGKKHVFTDVFKDTNGEYHDEYIYEFVNKERM